MKLLLLVPKRMTRAKAFFLSLLKCWNIPVMRVQLIKVWVLGKRCSENHRNQPPLWQFYCLFFLFLCVSCLALDCFVVTMWFVENVSQMKWSFSAESILYPFAVKVLFFSFSSCIFMLSQIVPVLCYQIAIVIFNVFFLFTFTLNFSD